MKKLALLTVLGLATLLGMGQTITIDNLVASLNATTQIGPLDQFYILQGTGKRTTLGVPINTPLTLGQNGVSTGTLNLNGGTSGQSQLVAGSTGALTLTGPSPQLSLGAVGGTSGNLQLNGSSSGAATLGSNTTGGLGITSLNGQSTLSANGGFSGSLAFAGTTSGNSFLSGTSTGTGLTLTGSAGSSLLVGSNGGFAGVLQLNGSTSGNTSIQAGATGSGATWTAPGGVVFTNSVTSGQNGGSSGAFFLNGSSSGTAQMFTNSTGALGLQAVAGQGVLLQDGGNGTVLQTLNTGGTVANTLGLTAGTTGNAVALATFGTDTNSNITLAGKGTGAALVHGIGTNTAAPAGYIGEVISATQSTPQNLTVGTAINVTSISLTAGDWDVAGACQFPNVNNITSTTANGVFICSISTTSLTADGTDLRDATLLFPTTASAPAAIPRYMVGPSQFLFSTTTTVFLVTQFSGGGTITFGSGTNIQSTGTIRARRLH